MQEWNKMLAALSSTPTRDDVHINLSLVRVSLEPGDTGYLTEDGRLVITGRDADLINFGKMKISPYAIEELVLDYAGILDCGAFSFLSKTNERRLAVAIVGDSDLNLKLMTSAITRELGEMAPQTYFVTDEIPRDALGKIQRDQLEHILHQKVVHQTNEQSEEK